MLKDPYGAVRIAVGRRCRKDPMPVGTVVIRSDTSPTGRRICTRYVKVKDDGPPGRRWINYARWWWLTNKGPIPAGKLVLHKDGDVLNDDPSNFVLGGPAEKLLIAHSDKKWSREQHARAASACAESNRRRGRAFRAKRFVKHTWYPVVDEMGVILNLPFRKRKRVLASFGIDVSRYPANGHGKKSGSEVQRALRSCRVRPEKSSELASRRYSTYCLLDPATRTCTGPMSASLHQIVAQLNRMDIWVYAEKHAKKDKGDMMNRNDPRHNMFRRRA